MCAGCVIISEQLPTTYFYLNSLIIQVTNWKEGIRIARELINDVVELERRSKMTLNWYEEKCSEKVVAQYMVKCMESINEK